MTVSKIWPILLGICLFCPGQAVGLDLPEQTPPSGASETVSTTVASGEGKTREVALTSALRHAVEQVLGTSMTSQTLVQNLRKLEDRVYSQVNGYIKAYAVVDEVRVPSGDYRVTVRAEVTKGELAKTVAEVTGTSSPFDGAALLANANLKEQQIEELEAEMLRWVDDLNLTGLKFEYETCVSPPNQSNRVEVSFRNVRISFKPERIQRFRQVQQRLRKDPLYPEAELRLLNSIQYTCLRVRLLDESQAVLYEKELRETLAYPCSTVRSAWVGEFFLNSDKQVPQDHVDVPKSVLDQAKYIQFGIR